VIIFIINYFQSKRSGVPGKLVPAFDIFLIRDYVGVAEKDSRSQTLFHHPFYDGGGTRRATAMKEDPFLFQIHPIRQHRFERTTLKMSHN
jgi:hypothetical protein